MVCILTLLELSINIPLERIKYSDPLKLTQVGHARIGRHLQVRGSGILPVGMAMNTQVVEHKETVFLDLLSFAVRKTSTIIVHIPSLMVADMLIKVKEECLQYWNLGILV